MFDNCKPEEQTYQFTFDELYSLANIIRERPMSNAETRAAISKYLSYKKHETKYLKYKEHEKKVKNQDSK